MLLAVVLCFAQPTAQAQPPAPQAEAEKGVERVTLEREKQVPLWMELYIANPDPLTPMLVLFHQARSSKGEYRPIAPRLKTLGYNCLAVDLSCGGAFREVKNISARIAQNSGRTPTYLDGLVDMRDTLRWARENRAHGKLVAWGSSYTASLSLMLAAEHPEWVDGVVAFSPGEYFTAVGKSATWIAEAVREVACPVFVSSARSEEPDWKPIFAALGSKEKHSFLPAGPGTHGSSALFVESAGSAEYWTAIEAYLERYFPPAAAASEGK
jgi:pimeloyl-ACP methyl ester carboxylesterase